jgi:hypothetical protein
MLTLNNGTSSISRALPIPAASPPDKPLSRAQALLRLRLHVAFPFLASLLLWGISLVYFILVHHTPTLPVSAFSEAIQRACLAFFLSIFVPLIRAIVGRDDPDPRLESLIVRLRIGANIYAALGYGGVAYLIWTATASLSRGMCEAGLDSEVTGIVAIGWMLEAIFSGALLVAGITVASLFTAVSVARLCQNLKLAYMWLMSGRRPKFDDWSPEYF